MAQNTTFSRKERHIIYSLLLAEIEWDRLLSEADTTQYGLCSLIENLFGIYPKFRPVLPGHISWSAFPELYAKKPKSTGAYWFGIGSFGWEERIKILKQCIEETAY